GSDRAPLPLPKYRRTASRSALSQRVIAAVTVDLPEPSAPTNATSRPPWGTTRRVGTRKPSRRPRATRRSVHSRVQRSRQAVKGRYVRYVPRRGRTERRKIGRAHV